MSKGLRTETKRWIEAERASDPLALGPYIGALAMELNVSTAQIAVIVGVHEQTMFRWVTNRAAIHPKWIPKVIKVLSVLCWMHDTKVHPLSGSAERREKQLATAFGSFMDVAKGIQKTNVKA